MGNFLNEQNVIWFMLAGIQSAIDKLKYLGVSITPLGPAAISVPGVESLAIAKRELLRKPNVEILEDVMVTRLIRSDGRIAGAVALVRRS